MAFHSGERNKVQELYNACSMVLFGDDGPPPTLDEIRWLQDLLGTMEAVDVGIDGSDDDDENSKAVDPSSPPGSSRELISGCKVAKITYIHIHECEEFSMGVFCFPAGAKIPLHDHPEMVVLSKVLYGSVSVKAYDWVRAPDHNYRKRGLARLTVDNRVLDASCPASVLFPTSGGNIHSFTALTPCAILDVLSPPYAEEQGRPSTYYMEIPVPSLPGFAILDERDIPKELDVTTAPYLGPELVLDDADDDEEVF